MTEITITILLLSLLILERFPAHDDLGTCRTSERKRKITMLQPAYESDLTLRKTQVVF